jgi:hypothetical protein
MQEVDMALEKHKTKWTVFDCSQPTKNLDNGILSYNYGRSFKSSSMKSKPIGTSRKIDKAH